LIIHACSEANFWRKYFFANFSLVSYFQCEASGWTYSNVLAVAVRMTCQDGMSTCLKLASLFLPYTHLCIFIDLSWHVMCFSRGFLPRFWHSLHISSHPRIFIASSVILLSFCAFRILEYFLGYFLETVCMKILFCLSVGLILIYLGHLDYNLCFCNTWESN
jgi:hypothetical protein